MGVERQGAKVNWLSSIAMVVAAGTAFRMRNTFRKIGNIKVSELKERAGLLYRGPPQQPSIVPKPVNTQPGKW